MATKTYQADINSGILFVKKSLDESVDSGLDVFDVEQVFMSSDDLSQIRDAVSLANDRLYVSWASVDAVDRDNEVIPIEDIISQQDILLQRNGPITDNHTNKVVGQTLAYKVMRHPRTKTLGVLHLNKIFNHNPLDDKVWEEIKSGKRTGSSVGGLNERKEFVERDGKTVTALEGFHHYETASVYKPANQWSLNEAVAVVAKSARDLGVKDRVMHELMKRLDSYEGEVSKEDFQKAFADSYEAAMSSGGESQSSDILSAEKTSGEKPMEEEIKKQFEDRIAAVENSLEQVAKMGDAIKKMASTVEELAKAKKEDAANDSKPEDMPADDSEDEKKKTKKSSSVSKEDAASDVDGESDAPAPETPEPEESNDEDVFKKLDELTKQVKKLQQNNVTKSTTPRPFAPSKEVSDVKKSAKTAYELAMGKTRKTWNEIHKMARDSAQASANAQLRTVEEVMKSFEEGA